MRGPFNGCDMPEKRPPKVTLLPQIAEDYLRALAISFVGKENKFGSLLGRDDSNTEPTPDAADISCQSL